MGPKVFRTFGFLVALLLSGCAGLGGTFSVDRFLYKDISGDTAGACMARSYQAWARHKAWVEVNYAGAAELAARGEAAKSATTLTAYYCTGPSDSALQVRLAGFWEIGKTDPARACACGNAIVEVARWSCAGPGDDKTALQRRLDAQAAACEGAKPVATN